MVLPRDRVALLAAAGADLGGGALGPLHEVGARRADKALCAVAAGCQMDVEPLAVLVVYAGRCHRRLTPSGGRPVGGTNTGGSLRGRLLIGPTYLLYRQNHCYCNGRPDTLRGMEAHEITRRREALHLSRPALAKAAG